MVSWKLLLNVVKKQVVEGGINSLAPQTLVGSLEAATDLAYLMVGKTLSTKASLKLVSMFKYAVKPIAANATYVKSATKQDTVAVKVDGNNMTQPLVARVLSATGGFSGQTGNVVISGHDLGGALISDTIALNGTATVAGTKAMKDIVSATLPIETHPHVSQVETATAAGTITAGTKQVETGTAAAGSLSADGNIVFKVTAANFNGGAAKSYTVAASNGDTVALYGAKIMAALLADAALCALWTPTYGATHDILVLTAVTAAANDTTLNMDFFSGPTGFVAAHTSANTTAGVAPGTGNVLVTVTTALLVSPEVLHVAVVAGDTAAVWAGKVRAALAANTNVKNNFSIGGATTAIILTAKVAAANDSTLNIALDNDTSTGVSTAATSAHTTAGTAYDTVSIGVTAAIGVPHPLTSTAQLVSANFNGSTDSGSLAATGVLSTTLYTAAGAASFDGTKELDLVYVV